MLMQKACLDFSFLHAQESIVPVTMAGDSDSAEWGQGGCLSLTTSGYLLCVITIGIVS